jgi:hypothetical protein
MLPQGLNDSSFATTSPLQSLVTRFNLNKGVCPINSETKLAILAISSLPFENESSNFKIPAYGRQANFKSMTNDLMSKIPFYNLEFELSLGI